MAEVAVWEGVKQQAQCCIIKLWCARTILKPKYAVILYVWASHLTWLSIFDDYFDRQTSCDDQIWCVFYGCIDYRTHAFHLQRYSSAYVFHMWSWDHLCLNSRFETWGEITIIKLLQPVPNMVGRRSQNVQFCTYHNNRLAVPRLQSDHHPCNIQKPFNRKTMHQTSPRATELARETWIEVAHVGRIRRSRSGHWPRG